MSDKITTPSGERSSLDGRVRCKPHGRPTPFDGCRHLSRGVECKCPHDCIHADKQKGADMIRSGPDQDGRWYLTPNA